MNRFSAEFFVRPGCHLCDEAAPCVRRAVRFAGFALVVRDIESDDRLVRDFGLRVPVVVVEGTVLAEGIIDCGRLWRRLVGRRLRGLAGSRRSAGV